MISLPAFLPGNGASVPASTLKSGVSAAMPEDGVAGFAGRMPAPDSVPASYDHRASSAWPVAAESGLPGPGSEAAGADPHRFLFGEAAMPEHAFIRTAPAENLRTALPAGSVPVPDDPPVAGDTTGSMPLPEMPPVAGDAVVGVPLPEMPLVAGDAVVGVPLPEMPPVTGEVTGNVVFPIVPPEGGLHNVASLPTAVGSAEAMGEQIRMPVQLWRLQQQAQQGAHSGEQTPPATAMGQRQAAPAAHVPLLQRLGGAEIATVPAAAAGTDTSAVLPLIPAAARPALATAHEWAPVSLSSTDKAMLGEQLLKTLKDKVELQLNQQVQQARIKLDPPEMGRMELTVRLEGDRLHIQINASHAGIRDAIAAQADRLRYDLLSQHGGGVEVSVGQHDRQPSSSSFNNDIEMGAELAEAGDDIRLKTAGAGWINALV
ncbi:flagellar hook-length control protein FliK [Oceanimonas baumannii]|uniref:flagellar hook-length control protein FliK n=1 Tax=Oceanimonas baumannii TaxID=129578 RepID=UPI003A931FA3